MHNDQDKNILVSVVIPVYNGIATIKSCLDGIFSQTVKDSMEVIAIDSGSKDGTLEVLESYKVRIHHLNPGEFNHGDTRNLGVKLAKGEFVVMTVQDATPASKHWIEMMLPHFENPLVAGVCGQQVVGHEREKNPLQWFRPATKANPFTVHFEDTSVFTEMSGKDQHHYCNWDDVNAVYRRSIKEKIPFKKLMFSEDTLWAKDALSMGYALVYDYRARVFHYHHQNFKFYFKRGYIMLYQNYKFYNYINYPKNPFMQIPQIIYRLLKMEELRFGEKLKWMCYNINLVNAAWSAALIFGFNATFRGMKGVESSQKYFVGFPPQGAQAKKK